MSARRQATTNELDEIYSNLLMATSLEIDGGERIGPPGDHQRTASSDMGWSVHFDRPVERTKLST